MGCTSSKSARTREPSDKPEGAQREPSTEEESSQQPTKESPFHFASGLTDCIVSAAPLSNICTLTISLDETGREYRRTRAI